MKEERSKRGKTRVENKAVTREIWRVSLMKREKLRALQEAEVLMKALKGQGWRKTKWEN